ncbi:MAG TPA: peptide chain release factor-like protein [Candidatus Omnitrophota bacterium]|nr:peptide chain release factor-like protein [Candidatus Omnitrophota bacterium]
MNIYPVTEKKQQELIGRLARLGIRESDLEESFVCSGGPGGQNVNKVATCVILKHIPTGLSIRCQKERTQAMNRYWARRMLADKLETQSLGRESEESKRIFKIRRQKRKRSKRAKDKMLAAKQKRGELKRLRARPADE